jgi:hypothetical protein
MTTNEHIDKLIHNLLNNGDFPLVPHLHEPDKDLKYSFDFFTNLGSDIILRSLINEKEHTKFEDALNIISHYKGKIKFFDKNLTFDEYSIIKPHLDEASKLQYRNIFYEEYARRIMNGKSTEIAIDLVNFIYAKDLDLFINIAKKLNIVDAVNKIYDKNPEKVFDWINGHPNKYQQLIQLNQPQFIFNNMNGKLDINDDSLRYFFEITPMDINILKEIKKTLGLPTIWKFTHQKVPAEFYTELMETIDEFLYVLNQPHIKIESVEQILKTLKEKFPHIYSNFNSLMFLKNDFYNK